MFPETFSNVIQTKSYSPSIYDQSPSPQASGLNFSFGEYLGANGEFDLVAFEAIRLYSKCLPLTAAIDMRARAFANLSIKVFNKTEGKFIDDPNHPVLKLLANPNSGQTRREFLIAYSSFQDITGDSFLTINSMGENAPPLEIFTKTPTELTIMTSTSVGTAGFPGKYLVNNPFAGQEVFTLNDMVSNRFRYFTDDGDQELWQSKTFNPLMSGNHLFGRSPAQAIWLECQQYIEGNLTNHSNLKKGVRPSGAFVNTKEKPLTDTQWARLQELAAKYTGSSGSGKAFAGDGVTFVPTTMDNREMEFQKLQTDMFSRVSYRFNIPIPLFSDKATTYNNLSTALFQFYDLSVTPHAEKLLEELSVFLMRRYPDSENLELRFDKAEVDALKLRSFEEGKALRAINVNSDNELRTVIGYEETTDGDVVWKPSMLVPAGMDSDTRGNDQDPPIPSKFMEVMMTTKNKETGEPYTPVEAYEIAMEHGLIDEVA